MIPYGRQDISEADIDAVVSVLRSDFLTQGPTVPRFEQAVADYCGAQHAVAVNSATTALHIACLALGVGPGDVVWTSPDHLRGQRQLRAVLRRAGGLRGHRSAHLQPERRPLGRKTGPGGEKRHLPKVVIPVHLCGQPCDMAGIHALASGTASRSSKTPRMPSAANTKASRSATAATATSPCSASTRSRSSPPPKAAWR